MMEIEVHAQARQLQGTGASRRLRREGKVPGIVYGGKEPAVSIQMDHAALALQLRKESFHASILTLITGERKEPVLLRAVNMHPWRLQVQHIDFQRVLADKQIHMKVPLHFVNADVSPAVKLSAAVVSHVMNEIDVSCLPADLPEFIEVDLSDLQVGHAVHVNDLKLPPGVEPVLKGENPVVVVAQIPRAAVVEEETAAAEATPAASAVPAAKQPEKAEEKKPDEKKKPEEKKKVEEKKK
jgi:large subunit ribosomal protein L25